MYYVLSSNIRVIVANAIFIRNELFAEGQSKRKKSSNSQTIQNMDYFKLFAH